METIDNRNGLSSSRLTILERNQAWLSESSAIVAIVCRWRWQQTRLQYSLWQLPWPGYVNQSKQTESRAHICNTASQQNICIRS